VGVRSAKSLLRRALSRISAAVVCIEVALPLALPVAASARFDAGSQPADRNAREGGTLRVVTPIDPGVLDPALARPAVYPIWVAT
jgi:hypothetical protein